MKFGMQKIFSKHFLQDCDSWYLLSIIGKLSVVKVNFWFYQQITSEKE